MIKRTCQLLLAFAVFSMILIGCTQDPVNIDEKIPSLPDTQVSANAVSTSDDTDNAVSTSDDTDPVETTPPPRYENTYEGKLQQIYDDLFAFTRDIKAAQGSEGYNKAYDTALSLAEKVLKGKEEFIEQTETTSNIKGVIATYFEIYIVRLFEQYPEQAKKETDLIEFARYFCYIYTNVELASAERMYQNDDFYYTLFPNTDELVIENTDSGVKVSYAGYSGDLVYLERADRLNRVRHYTIHKDSFIVTNYSGPISVAPVNQYGATGRTTQVQINALNPDIITRLLISGDYFMTNPVGSSQAYLEAANNKKVRTASPHYLELIQNVDGLEYLQIYYCEITDADALFDKIPVESIGTLDLSNNLLTELDLTSFTSLGSLELWGNTSLASLKLPVRKSILYVGLRDTGITDLSMFASYDLINNLDIRGTKITSLAPLADKTIYTLRFDADTTDYHGLEKIEGLRRLSIISEKPLSDELLEIVKGIPTITEVTHNGKPVALK